MRLLDMNTGELRDSFATQKKRLGTFNKYIGIETKYVSACSTREELLNVLTILDGYIHAKPKIHSECLVEMLTTGCIHKRELALLTYIAQNLSGWNIYIGTIKELTQSGVDASHIAQILKASSYVKMYKQSEFSSNVKIELHPMIAWKGDNAYRENALKDWYKTPMN